MLLLLLATGCIDYGLDKLADGELLPGADSADTGALSGEEPDADSGDPGQGSTQGPPEVDCEEVDLGTWSWLGSPSLQGPEDPVDAQGLPFWEPEALLEGWTAAGQPDLDIPVHHDRAYRSTVHLDPLPPGLELSLQSDDGIWLWVNGSFVGHWGGGWQEEGCVNDNANCLYTVSVDAVDVTEHLRTGANVIAARVSNPVANAWFEVIPSCVE